MWRYLCTGLLAAGVSVVGVAEPARGETLATINDEPITLEEYLGALGTLHAEAMESTGTVPRQDPMALLERLVRLRLVLQEARTIGLDELDEYRKPAEMIEKQLLRDALLRQASAATPSPSPERVEERYREMVAEVEIESVLFDDREEAVAFLETLGEGGDFAALGRTAVEQGAARRLGERGHTTRARLAPSVVAAIAELAPGEVSAPIQLEGGVALIRFFGSRLPDDPKIREDAEREVRAADRSRTLREYVDGLIDRYLVFDQPLIDSLDFESDPGAFERFLADDRVIVRVEGGEPIRVRDLAAAMGRRMFHGVDQAAKSKRLNKTKNNVLEEMTTETILQREARRLGLDLTEEYHSAFQELTDQLLFGVFVSRVIDPSIEVSDEKIRGYYESHLADYRGPEMLRLQALTFSTGQAAQRALEHLNAGADFAWTRANAAGQLPAEEIPPALRFDGRLLTRDSLPQGLLEAITGAGTGDFRLYTDPEGRHHVLLVERRVPSTPNPLESVREEVAGKVFLAERAVAVEDFMAKLREASDVEILVDSDGLRALITAEGP